MTGVSITINPGKELIRSPSLTVCVNDLLQEYLSVLVVNNDSSFKNAAGTPNCKAVSLKIHDTALKSWILCDQGSFKDVQ